MKVKDRMTRDAVAVAAEESAAVAARLMARCNVGSLPVCGEDGRLVGMVTDRDLVLRCMAMDEDPATFPVSQVMTARVAAVSPEDELAEAAVLMAREQVRRLPVTENGRLAGIVTLSDLGRGGDYAMEAAQCLGEISKNIKKR